MSNLILSKIKTVHVIWATVIVGFSVVVYFYYFHTEKFFLLDYQTKMPIAHAKVKVLFREYCEGSDYNDDLKRIFAGCGPDVLFDGTSASDGSINISTRYIKKMNESYGANGGADYTYLSEITLDGYSRLTNKSLLGEQFKFNHGKNYTHFMPDNQDKF